jgi:non-ribosomal peptide synthetase component F
MAGANSVAPAAMRAVPASPAQELRWRSSAYQLANRVYRLSGPLDVPALEAAFATLVAEHESLRTSLHMEDGGLRMHIHPSAPTPLSVLDVRDRPASEREAALQRHIGEQVRESFDRDAPPLLRATLIRLDPHEHVLVLIVDHIVSDGWSVSVVARDISRHYREALGETLPLRGAVTQYPDVAARQREGLTEERLVALASFYERMFPNGPSDMAVALPGFRAPASSATQEPPAGVTLRAVLGRDETEGFRRVAAGLRQTPFVVAATLFVQLLRRESRQERITLSTSFAGRTSSETESTIGYLASSVWVPTQLGDGGDLAHDTRTFQKDMLAVISNADVPPRVVFERLWGRNARAEMDRLPQVDFLFTPFWGDELDLPGIVVEASDADEGVAESALSMYLTDRGTHIDAQFRFPPDRVQESYARSVFGDYLDALRGIAAPA